MPAPRPRALAGLAVVPVVLALLAGCTAQPGDGVGDRAGSEPGPSLSPSPIRPGPSVGGGTAGSGGEGDPALARYYDQELDWSDCGADECARLEVPLDYAVPGGRAISLGVLRVPATHPDRRIGSLLVNPGGPGSSGVAYAARADSAFGVELRAAFDVVGFDPRGVGDSTPVQCLPDRRLDRFVAADPDPDSTAERRRSDRLLRRFGDGCLRRSGGLAEHVSTEEAARDVDVLRAALGDGALSWFGASYGTFLGATYAGLFPDKVGRMVLDGAVDPSLSSLRLNLVQAEGFETALRAYVGACVDRGGCFLGETVDAGTRRIRTFLDRVEQQPVPAGDRRLAAGNAVLGIWAPLYNESFWPTLDTALRSAFSGDGTTLLALADSYVSRGPGGYADNSLEALYAINCLDRDDDVTSAEAAAYVPRFERASPTFGAIFAYSLSTCSQWPVETGREPAPITASGAAAILVVGTSRDPATPLAWAEALASQLESGVLVRRDGDGHTGYRVGNTCVDQTVESYLVEGAVPASTVDC